MIPPVVNAPARTITPLPEVQIDKNRHVGPLFPFDTPCCLSIAYFDVIYVHTNRLRRSSRNGYSDGKQVYQRRLPPYNKPPNHLPHPEKQLAAQRQ